MAAQGLANNKLRILVAAQFAENEAVVELKAKGHEIIVFDATIDNVDLILHPSAHFWNDMMWDFLPAALTAARKRKRERGSV